MAPQSKSQSNVQEVVVEIISKTLGVSTRKCICDEITVVVGYVLHKDFGVPSSTADVMHMKGRNDLISPCVVDGPDSCAIEREKRSLARHGMCNVYRNIARAHRPYLIRIDNVDVWKMASLICLLEDMI